MDHATNALLIETNLTLADRDTWFGRFEIVGKAAHDLDVPHSLVHDVEGTETFTVAKLQGGYTRYFTTWKGLRPGLGVSASAGFVPTALETVYGSRAMLLVGLAAWAYVRYGTVPAATASCTASSRLSLPSWHRRSSGSGEVR